MSVICFFVLLVVARPALPQFTTFDAPGAGTGVLQGTVPYVINAAGEVAGIYLDSGFIWHGFLRAASGAITMFDVPGARQSPCQPYPGPGCGTAGHLGTSPTGIDTAGDISGVWEDTSFVYHGFVRAANGTITTFDVPGASTIAGQGDQGTVPLSVNTAGVIAGTYADANSAWHGFVRAANGTVTTFDAAGAGTGWRQGTVPLGVDTAGDVTGYYRDTNNAYHGFVRAADGTTTSIDVPGAGTGAFEGTIGVSINDSGIITGSYTNTSYVFQTLALAAHGFVRAADGTITTFDAPGAALDTGLLQGTISGRINTAGSITGLYADASGILHGFVRLAAGTTTSFDAPGAGTGLLQGTAGVAINDSGVVAGAYADGSEVLHGFVGTPAGVYPVAGISPTSLTFGDQVVGTSSASQPVKLSNTGTAGLTITSITATGDFSQANNCGGSVAAGGSCTINVTFSPTAGGTRTGTLTVTDNSNGVAGSTQTVSLSGTGVSPGASLTPNAVAFGNQVMMTVSPPRLVTLTSTGTAELNISAITITGPNARDFIETNSCPASLSPGDQCSIHLVFYPSILGKETASLTVADDAANSPQTAKLSGTGVLPVVLIPTSLNFGNQVEHARSRPKTVTLTNNLDHSLRITSVNTTRYFAQTNTCGRNVAPQGKCIISVTFTPGSIGMETGKLSVTDDAYNSPQTVSLSGTGIP